MTDKTTEAFDAWWVDEGEQSLYALNTTTDDDIKILAGIAWEAAVRQALAEQDKCACDSRAWCTKYKKCNREMLGLPKAQPVKQEPVGVVESSEEWGVAGVLIAGLPIGTKLYAAPVSAEAIRAEAYQKGRDEMKEEAAKEAWNLAPTDESAGEIAAAIRGLK